MASIHPTAIVDTGAEIDGSASIGAYTLIGPHVKIGAGTSVGEMAYLAPNPELRTHSADVLVSEPATTVSFTPHMLEQLSISTRHLFDAAFIRVLVRRLHAAHEAVQHPRRIL